MKNILFFLLSLVLMSCSVSSDLISNYTIGPNVTDVEGNVYASITNNGLTLTKQNYNASKFADGTPIPQVQDQAEWASLTTAAWCYYNNESANGTTYGKLYNWYAVMGIYDAASAANPALRKQFAPTGWHVPTDAEWTLLTDCLGGEAVAGGKLKAKGTIQDGAGLWQEPNTDATNFSGFTAIPEGYRTCHGLFTYLNERGYWWTATEKDSMHAWFRYVMFDASFVSKGGYFKEVGFSVRLIKD